MKIGFMGGTFDPIHIGHLIMGLKAREWANLDQIWFIPTGMSYMKDASKITSANDRLNMVKLATKDVEQFQVNDIEIKRNGATYTYETLIELKQLYPDNEYYFIFGADCLFSIEHWKNPELIFSNCKCITAVRNNVSLNEMEQQINKLKNQYNAEIEIMQFDNIEISSTDIRNRVKENKLINYFVTDSVYKYIKENKLYI